MAFKKKSLLCQPASFSFSSLASLALEDDSLQNRRRKLLGRRTRTPSQTHVFVQVLKEITLQPRMPWACSVLTSPLKIQPCYLKIAREEKPKNGIRLWQRCGLTSSLPCNSSSRHIWRNLEMCWRTEKPFKGSRKRALFVICSQLNVRSHNRTEKQTRPTAVPHICNKLLHSHGQVVQNSGAWQPVCVYNSNCSTRTHTHTHCSLVHRPLQLSQRAFQPAKRMGQARSA